MSYEIILVVMGVVYVWLLGICVGYDIVKELVNKVQERREVLCGKEKTK